MLKRQGQQIRDCHERAAEAKRTAEATANPALRAQYLDMEDRWLLLARSYAFTESLGDFTAANSERQHKFDEHIRANVASDDALPLHENTISLIEEGNLDSLYARLIEAAIDLMSSDMGSMQLFHPQRNELQLVSSKGFHPDSAAFWQWARIDSGSTCGMALHAGRRVIVPEIETCASMAGTADLDEYRRSNIRAVQSTPLMSRSGQLLGMISTHWREPHQPTKRELNRLDVLGRQAADLIERGKAEAALRENEERSSWLASIVESSDDAIVSKNLDGIITSWNRGAERVFGYTAQEAIGKPITMLIPPERHGEERMILERIGRGERIEHFETVRQRKHGSFIVISLTVSPIRDARGKVVGASKIARDITQQKRLSEQTTMLAREAEHRTKNVLATIEAIVALSHANTADGLKRAIKGRIQALANVHSLFIQSRWTGAELFSLVTQELAPYRQDDEGRVLIEGPQSFLETNVAQAIAMALHELATNAAKYGALSAAKGQVEIKWSIGAGGRLVLRWTERGGPPAKMPRRQGFGTKVLDRMIKEQSKGKIQHDWRPEGLTCEIAIQL